MIKKISVTALQPGMYVHDLNCPWPQHSFLAYRFPIRSAKDVDRIRELGILEIYIDTELGLDAPVDDQTGEASLGSIPSTESIDAGQSRERTPLARELAQAKVIYEEAVQLVGTLMRSVRLGRQVELDRVRPVVSAMVGSVLRNPDALLHMARLKQRDHYTFQHSVATATLVLAFSRELNMDRELMEQIGLGGLLHDIGKLKVPAHILNKPGALDQHELTVMRRHVEYSCDLLDGNSNLSPVVLEIVAQHHERYNGSGYPLRLRGEAISVYGQMASIVDVYDAITTDRIYHPAQEPSVTLRRLLEWSNGQFAPELPSHFIRAIGIYPVGSLVRLESGLLAVVIEQYPGRLLHPRVRAVFDTRSGTPITPYDIDLASPSTSDRIRQIEIPSRWNIDVNRYL